MIEDDDIAPADSPNPRKKVKHESVVNLVTNPNEMNDATTAFLPANIRKKFVPPTNNKAK